MPFTLSHPAAIAVLPRTIRRHLPLAALAIGTMTPDFEYLVRLRPLSLWSHTLAGVATFCLPVGLLAWCCWEYIVRSPTRELLVLAQGRARHPLTAGTVVRAGIAVLVGALTHLLWDGFTHAGRIGAALFPSLEHEAWRIGDYSLRWFGVLQHLSTIVGFVVVAVWLRREYRRCLLRWAPGSLLPVATLLAVAVGAGLLNAFGPQLLTHAPDPGTIARLARFAVGGMVGIAAALLLYSSLRRLRGV